MRRWEAAFRLYSLLPHLSGHITVPRYGSTKPLLSWTPQDYTFLFDDWTCAVMRPHRNIPQVMGHLFYLQGILWASLGFDKPQSRIWGPIWPLYLGNANSKFLLFSKIVNWSTLKTDPWKMDDSWAKISWTNVDFFRVDKVEQVAGYSAKFVCCRFKDYKKPRCWFLRNDPSSDWNRNTNLEGGVQDSLPTDKTNTEPREERHQQMICQTLEYRNRSSVARSDFTLHVGRMRRWEAAYRLYSLLPHPSHVQLLAVNLSIPLKF